MKKIQTQRKKVIKEVQTVKYAINRFLGIIIPIFDSDACTLYLINVDMAEYEQSLNLRDRLIDQRGLLRYLFGKKDVNSTNN